MDIMEVLKLADELVFARTGKHLDYLQEAILQGTLQGETYATISENVYTSEGHVRDVGSELWKLLSEGLGKEVSKTNFRAILNKNYSAIVGDHATVTNVICSNYNQKNNHSQTSEQTQSYVDLGNAPERLNCYGRREELAILDRSILTEKCRLFALLGFSGIGKTTLALHWLENNKTQFEYAIYRSLRFYTDRRALLANILSIFTGNPQKCDRLETQISHLLTHLRQSRCLILLDDGQLLCRDERGKQVLRAIAEINHQSCIILISTEKPLDITPWEKSTYPVRSLILSSLGDAAKDLFQEQNLSDPEHWHQLIDYYQGNPLWLILTATSIQELFAGRVADFLAYETLIVSESLQGHLDQQFQQLSAPEQTILHQVATLTAPVSLSQLLQLNPFSPVELFQIIQSLHRRFFLEMAEDTRQLFLNPVIQEYIKNGK
ncbi:MAG: AAA family ATPase [Roseofilum sp. SBFL]|uniref:AAA family ATPase n=1 Tax=unclassified Roseofilum TaxID=2620099 RepID=UPI001B275E65|nr:MULTISPECIES: AAA family ATPase [unclassified Roseofilum]MBP0037114.1 AAA family ATPase [Roseofilum sp. SID1]MBP0042942.1 AAA family ATPase [Roseofilum sp. SBFL]